MIVVEALLAWLMFALCALPVPLEPPTYKLTSGTPLHMKWGTRLVRITTALVMVSVTIVTSATKGAVVTACISWTLLVDRTKRASSLPEVKLLSAAPFKTRAAVWAVRVFFVFCILYHDLFDILAPDKNFKDDTSNNTFTSDNDSAVSQGGGASPQNWTTFSNGFEGTYYTPWKSSSGGSSANTNANTNTTPIPTSNGNVNSNANSNTGINTTPTGNSNDATESKDDEGSSVGSLTNNSDNTKVNSNENDALNGNEQPDPPSSDNLNNTLKGLSDVTASLNKSLEHVKQRVNGQTDNEQKDPDRKMTKNDAQSNLQHDQTTSVKGDTDPSEPSQTSTSKELDCGEQEKKVAVESNKDRLLRDKVVANKKEEDTKVNDAQSNVKNGQNSNEKELGRSEQETKVAAKGNKELEDCLLEDKLKRTVTDQNSNNTKPEKSTKERNLVTNSTADKNKVDLLANRERFDNNRANKEGKVNLTDSKELQNRDENSQKQKDATDRNVNKTISNNNVNIKTGSSNDGLVGNILDSPNKNKDKVESSNRLRTDNKRIEQERRVSLAANKELQDRLTQARLVAEKKDEQVKVGPGVNKNGSQVINHQPLDNTRADQVKVSILGDKELQSSKFVAEKKVSGQVSNNNISITPKKPSNESNITPTLDTASKRKPTSQTVNLKGPKKGDVKVNNNLMLSNDAVDPAQGSQKPALQQYLIPNVRNKPEEKQILARSEVPVNMVEQSKARDNTAKIKSNGERPNPTIHKLVEKIPSVHPVVSNQPKEIVQRTPESPVQVMTKRVENKVDAKQSNPQQTQPSNNNILMDQPKLPVPVPKVISEAGKKQNVLQQPPVINAGTLVKQQTQGSPVKVDKPPLDKLVANTAAPTTRSTLNSTVTSLKHIKD
jgi:hypothetical protein